MRYFVCVLVALCIRASAVYAAEPNDQQASTSEFLQHHFTQSGHGDLL